VVEGRGGNQLGASEIPWNPSNKFGWCLLSAGAGGNLHCKRRAPTVIKPVRFTVGQRRGSTCRITVLEATVLLDDSLKAVWRGSRMVSERRLVCEESQDVEEEDEQTERIAKLSPTNPYAPGRFGTPSASMRSTSTKASC
jgi:hypothetical protein